MLDDCRTGGEVGNSSIGYHVTNNADKTRLKNCGSQGHETAGYQIDAGVTNGAAEDCYSGGGDGPKSDPTHAFVWSDYHFDAEVLSDITYAGGTTYNIFKVTGIVQISELYGLVSEVIADTSSNIHLEAYSTGGTVDITASPGVDIDQLPVDSIIIKRGDSGDALVLASSATPAIIENDWFQFEKTNVICVADADQTTYIRSVNSVALASGKIHWHCRYEPLSHGAFVEAA